MTFDLASTIAATRSRMLDSANAPVIQEVDLQGAIRSAIAAFSRDMAAHYIAEFAGSDVSYFPILTTLPNWKEAFSAISQIYYPAHVVTGTAVLEPLEPELDWTVTEALVGSTRTLYLYLMDNRPTPSEQVRVFYSGFHQLTNLDSAVITTIPTAYEEAFYDLCAAFAHKRLAAQLARRTQPSMTVDVADYGDAMDRLIKMGDNYMASYSRALSIGMSLPGAASGPPADAWLDWDTNMTFGNDYMFHGHRYR